jgi:hypothetical protein
MSQYVIEFGAECIETITDTVVDLNANFPIDLQVLWSDRFVDLNYEPINLSLIQVLEKLKQGEVSSIIVRPRNSQVVYYLITPPNFNRKELSFWMATVEITNSDWRPLWNFLLGRERLRFISVGTEEGVEHEDNLLTPETFPWGRWPMVIGALYLGEYENGYWMMKPDKAQ